MVPAAEDPQLQMRKLLITDQDILPNKREDHDAHHIGKIICKAKHIQTKTHRQNWN